MTSYFLKQHRFLNGGVAFCRYTIITNPLYCELDTKHIGRPKSRNIHDISQYSNNKRDPKCYKVGIDKKKSAKRFIFIT
jgi:hypothetical protein